MIGLHQVYAVAGGMFAVFALLALRGRRPANAAFYALLTASLWFGDLFGALGNGAIALALAGIAASGRFRRTAREQADPVPQRGNELFVLALIIPVTALLGTLLFKQFPALVDAKQATLVALTVAVLVALGIGYVRLRPRIGTPFREGVRLMDDIGWAAVLPQMLASLGAIFALAGVGDVVGGLIGRAIPGDSLAGAVAAYAIGMALFTMIMGNAFAAFPVMAAAIGIPVLIRHHGGDPAPVAAIGMLAGFCGTLMTPMAANFNLVPAALLGLRDRNGVVKTQVPTAIPLLLFNILLLWWVLR